MARGRATRWSPAPSSVVHRAVARGLTNPEIGVEMYISARTVEWHLRNVFVKLGISSRRELRRWLPDADHLAPTTS